MLVEALAYFRRGENGERAFLAGAILSFSVAILLELATLVTTLLATVPAIALAGYFAQVLATSADGETAPPVFSFSTQLLQDGLLAIVVAGAYLLIPTLALGFTVGGALSIDATGTLSFPVTMRFYVGSAVVLFTVLAFVYLAPAAVVVALRDGSLRAGFGFADIRSLVGHAAYFIAWVLALAVIAFGALLASGLAVVPVVGPALAVFVGFYAATTATHLVGRGCAKAGGRPLSHRA